MRCGKHRRLRVFWWQITVHGFEATANGGQGQVWSQLQKRQSWTLTRQRGDQIVELLFAVFA